MAYKKMVWGMTGVLLAFALVLGGCDANADGDDGSGDFTDGSGKNTNGGNELQTVTLLELDDLVLKPARGETPDTSLDAIDTDEYTGDIAWQDADSNDAVFPFVLGTVYKAIATLTAKIGYTFTGAGTFTHNEAGTAGDAIRQVISSDGLSVTITITFPPTSALFPVTLRNLDNYVAVPVMGGTPNAAEIDNDEYSGTITWKTAADAAVSQFQPDTTYKAVLSLNAKEGYTFDGLVPFTRTGASVTKAGAGTSCIVTATFPVTNVVSLLNLDGYATTPVVGQSTNTAIDNDQYSGTITWTTETGSESVTEFLPATIYKAVLTLAAKTDYTFYGLAPNTFTHTGAASVVTQAADSVHYTVTVIFPETAALALTDVSQIGPYMETQEAPVALKLQMELSTANWQAILEALATAGNNVLLDLSACTTSGSTASGGLSTSGVFDPYKQDTDTNRRNGKSKIQLLILPDAATSIPDGTSSDTAAFTYFTGLKNVRGINVETIGRYAFQDCTSLEEVNFPEATTIRTSAFQDCTSLEEVNLPKVTSIHNKTFKNCTELITITLPEATTIRTSAFQYCTSLEEVNLPKVTSIDDSAFQYCTRLEEVNLPKVTSIDDRAFQYCTSLEEVNLPKVTSIGQDAFQSTGATALTVTLGAQQPTLGRSVLFNPGPSGFTPKTVTVKVPEASLETYRSDYDNSVSDTNNWGNAFRGKGWSGGETYLDGHVNTHISLFFVGYEN